MPFLVFLLIFIHIGSAKLMSNAHLIFGRNLKVTHLVEPRVDEGAHRAEECGARLVTNFVENISYKYMYGLNIVTIMV